MRVLKYSTKTSNVDVYYSYLYEDGCYVVNLKVSDKFQAYYSVLTAINFWKLVSVLFICLL